MVGLLLVLGLFAPNADVPLIEAAVAQVKAGRFDEAVRLLDPIQADAARADALRPRDRLLLFYTLGRAHEEQADGCAAHTAFTRARQARGLNRRERQRLDAALARVADRRGGRLQVECSDAAEVAGKKRRCPFTLDGLPVDDPVEVRFWLGAFSHPPQRVAMRSCESARIAAPPAGRLVVRGEGQATINGERVLLPADLAAPPGRYVVEAAGARRAVEVVAGRSAEVALQAPIAPLVEPRHRSATPWIVTGLLAAGAAATGTLALIKGGEHANAQDAYNAGRSTDRARVFALEDETNAYAIATLVLGLATASAAVWAFWARDDGGRAWVGPGGIGWRF